MIRKDKDVAYVLRHLFNKQNKAVFHIFNTETGALATAATDISVFDSGRPLPAFMLIDPLPGIKHFHAGEFTRLADMTPEEESYLRKMDQGRHSLLRDSDINSAFRPLPQRPKPTFKPR
jgi:hypothetical protein